MPDPRTCEVCGQRMPAFQPRRRNADGKLTCGSCPPRHQADRSAVSPPITDTAPNGRQTSLVAVSGPFTSPRQAEYAMMDAAEDGGTYTQRTGPEGITVYRVLDADQHQASLTVQAHDSVDQKRLFHCPFCGGGAITGSSTGSVTCSYCSATFTVQVQPQHLTQPQTNPLTGEPIAPGVDPLPQDGLASEPDPAPQELSIVPDTPDPAGLRIVPDDDSAAIEGEVGMPRESFLHRLALRVTADRDATLAEVRRHHAFQRNDFPLTKKDWRDLQVNSPAFVEKTKDPAWLQGYQAGMLGGVMMSGRPIVGEGIPAGHPLAGDPQFAEGYGYAVSHREKLEQGEQGPWASFAEQRRWFEGLPDPADTSTW